MNGRQETIKDYQERINKVLVYINDHVDEKLELEKLAAISNFSTFHFHRIIRAYLNEPLGVFVTRIRMDKAAALLEHTQLGLQELALKCGYEIPSSFNKAFKKRFGISPGDYRNGQRLMFRMEQLKINQNKTNMELKPKIKELKNKKVVYVRGIGNYNESAGIAWGKVCDFAGKNKLFGFKTEMIGVSHDDPKITEAEKLRYDACIVINKDVKPEGEVGVKEITGGKYAIFKHVGSYDTLNETYNAIYRVWLPESGMQLRELPCLEKYVNDPEKTKPEKLITEIMIPVE
jgi:AraC family transcriptional regulator